MDLGPGKSLRFSATANNLLSQHASIIGMAKGMMRMGISGTAMVAAVVGCGGGGASNSQVSTVVALSGYTQTVLASDQVGVGQVLDTNLTSPWGVTFAPGGNWAVASSASATSRSFSGGTAANPLALGSTDFKIPFNSPTGAVYNGTSDFQVTNGTFTGASTYLFASQTGWISGWNANVASAIAIAATSISGAIYTGLTIASNADGNFLYAADFSNGTVDVFDKNFALAKASGGFSDPAIPSAFHPFGIQAIGGSIYVAYAKYDTTNQTDIPSPGNGYVDKFDTFGNLQAQLVAGGNLNSPWGLALAPATFGGAANMLLVGNNGDGTINAYNPTSGAYVGTLGIDTQTVLTVSGLRAITFGGGGTGGSATSLYATASPRNQSHGQFIRIDSTASVPKLRKR